MELIRANEMWSRAGAYYVRIEARVKGFGIPMETEFDEHDREDTKYVIARDGNVPVGTCRVFFETDKIARIERVVVLEEYRKQGIGRLVVEEAEQWIAESGAEKIVITSRDNAVGFYEKIGYQADWNQVHEGEIFTTIYMEKAISADKGR